MTSPVSALFPAPYPAAERQSWRAIAAGLRNNALAGFPAGAFEEMAVARSFAGRTQIILNDPAAIRHVLIENAENYRRTASVSRLLRPVIGDGLFLADGEAWRGQRRAAAPAFAPRVVPTIAAHVARSADRLIGELWGSGAVAIELFPRLQLLALEIAAAALFSLDIGDAGPGLRAEMQGYADGIGRPTMLDFLLPRGWPTPRSWARWRFRRRWMVRIRQVLAARNVAPRPQVPRDLFDMMAAGGTSDEQLMQQSATMLAAGHETTAVALFWSLYLAASVPAAQERIAAEAAALDLSPAGAAAALPQLAYTRAVVDEALRLYPPAFSLVRQARASDAAAGIAIPSRAAVLIVPWVLHRHRRLWRDPDRFEPGRFLPDADPPERFSYLPFGAGPRACIGAQFALTETVLVLARLLQVFRIELADDRPVLPVAAITLQPDRSPTFRLQRRVTIVQK
ncbi:MAG TPA: cytochrome P450 [Stellaceae bacterium]|jgi:cytochrome P450|nr:cytochrome P450 [Stellaceae bacterium]